MTEAEIQNPPWNENFDEWEYRRVRFQGRLIHSKGIFNLLENISLLNIQLKKELFD